MMTCTIVAEVYQIILNIVVILTTSYYSQIYSRIMCAPLPRSHTLTAQDFRNTSQGDEEEVGNFIRYTESTFNVACGREGMFSETRDTLLHSHLQKGLKHELMRAPVVSGAQGYKELCLSAQNEKHLAKLRKRQQ